MYQLKTHINIYVIIITIGFVTSEIVRTKSGDVKGKLVSDGFASYYSFTGIPYAEPPTGGNRFLEPIPRKPWDDVFDATKEGPVCFQTTGSYTLEDMSEDCLILNIFSPYDRKDLLPVVFYIHAGEMKSLSARSNDVYGPQLFVRKDVIFVTMNYRLGALGFLSVGTEEAPGNAGVKDLLLALRWIKDNIESFGGDPNNITLGGNSAGAVLVHYLLLTTQSSGLFNRAFLISGSALGFRFLANDPLQNAQKLGAALGFQNIYNQTALLENLRSTEAYNMILATEAMGSDDLLKGFRPFSVFVPCVEPESLNAIITKAPLEIVRSGIPQNVPVLVGFNAQEGIKMYPTWKNETLLDFLNENHELIIPSNIRYPQNSDRAMKLAEEIKYFYFDDEDIGTDNLDGLINLISDSQFIYSIDSWIQIHKSNKNSSDLWYYIFDFDGDLNWYKLKNDIGIDGTAHADELGYLFVTNDTRDLIDEADTASLKVLDTLTTLWTDFAKKGNPSPSWAKVMNGDIRNHYILKEVPEMVFENPYSDRLGLWAKVYNDYYLYEAVWDFRASLR